MFKKMMKHLINNPGLKILSIVIAVILWLVVVNVDNPQITKSFSVPIEFINEDMVADMGKVYEVVGQEDNTEPVYVTINVTGPRKTMDLDMMTAANFTATVDLSQVDYQSPNEEKPVPINVTAKRYSDLLTITQSTRNLMVTLEDLAEEQVYVVGTTTGTPAEGYAIGEMTVSPNLINISGPQSVVSRIKRIGAVVDVEGAIADITVNAMLVLYDENGEVVESSQIKLSRDEVTVTVEILSTKTVPVVCETSGEPADGYVFTGVEYAPETVAIKGKAEALNNVSSITIRGEAINLDGATGDVENSIDITPYLPEGVSLVDPEENKIAVRAVVERLEVTTLSLPVENLEVLNLPEEYEVVYGVSAVSVSVRGRSEELADLTAEQLRASIDLNGLEPGSHRVELDITLNDDRFEVIGTAYVQVTVQEIGAEEEPGGTVPGTGGTDGTGTGTDGSGTGGTDGSGPGGGTGGSGTGSMGEDGTE